MQKVQNLTFTKIFLNVNRCKINSAINNHIQGTTDTHFDYNTLIMAQGYSSHSESLQLKKYIRFKT